MKKVIRSLLVFTTFLAMGACSTKTKEQTVATRTKASEKTEVSSGASEQTYTNPAEMKDSYDLIIVGAGGAGMAAAIEAKDAGLTPVIFEKMPVAGGNTLKSSSGMNASKTKFQKEKGIKDSTDAFYEETLKGGGGTSNQELLRYFVDHSADAIDWLDQNGIRLDNLTITGGMSEKRTHRPSDGSAIGGYLVDGLLKNIHKRNIPIFVNTEVTDINEHSGQVNEAIVHVQGEKPKKITGKAIVVTTGGYGASESFIQKYRPDLKGYVTTNQSGATGDGITMIEKLGGQVVDMDKIQIHPTVQQEEGVLIGEAVRGEGAILVNQNGERFVNELDTRDKVSAAITALPEKSAYLIFDQGVRERAKAIDFYEQKGYVVSGDSVANLAEKVKIPQSALTQTLKTWNQTVNIQKDEQFHRTTAMENKLSTAKYYAIKIAPGIHYTMGGVKINANTEVLNKQNQVITGLYAAGEVTGGLHGDNRIGGNSVAEIIIFGRQAGQQAAKFVHENQVK